MEVGCNTYSLRDLDRREAFARLGSLGLRTIELWAGHAPSGRGGADPRGVAAEAAEAGLAIHAYCIGGLFGLPPAEAAGVRFGIENRWYTEFARPSDYAPVLADASPAIGITIDTGHLAFLGCDLPRAAALLGPRTLHVHLKRVRAAGRIERLARRLERRWRMEPGLPGPDDRLDAFVGTLRAAGYDGVLAIEHEGTPFVLDDLRRWRERAAALVRTDGAPLPREAAHG
jgi:sugar phosphate isomerase/epimerase